MQNILEALQELRLMEAKEDVEKFKNKFGEKTYNDFIKAKDRLKNKKISTDLTYHVKNTSPDKMSDLIQSLYQKDTDKQRLRQIQGKDKEIRGKYRDLGIYGKYHVYQPLDYISSMDLGVNTGWCTTGRYGHAGHPDFAPSPTEAKKHFNEYTGNEIELYYLLDPETMYGEIAIAKFPEEDPDDGSNFVLYDSKDNEHLWSSSLFKKLPAKLVKDLELEYLDTTYDLTLSKDGTKLFSSEDWGSKKINIPDSVKIIEAHSLEFFLDLKSITIPAGVQKIGNNAFQECSSLKSVIFEQPSEVTDIGESAFNQCTSLRSIELPPKLKKISTHLFSGCENLKSVAIHSSVKNIGSYPFADCDSLKSIYVEEGSYAEQWCKKNGFGDKIKYIK